MRMFFLFLSIASTSFSQSKTAKGNILDKDTKQPIPYVNISILESQIGTSSNEDGSYLLEIEEKNFDKNVHLSSLGYKDSIIPVAYFITQKKLFLLPKTEQLKEITISKKFEENFLEVNPINRKDIKSGFATGNNPWKIALYFPYKVEYESNRYIKTLHVYLQQHILMESHPSKFRIRIFSIDENGFPDDDIISDEIIVETKKRQKMVVVDLSDYNLVFPKEGFYVALEWLHIPFNKYEINYTMEGEKGKHKMARYAPTFSAIHKKLNDFKVMHFSAGKWWDFPMKRQNKEEQIVPAISLILSN